MEILYVRRTGWQDMWTDGRTDGTTGRHTKATFYSIGIPRSATLRHSMSLAGFSWISPLAHGRGLHKHKYIYEHGTGGDDGCRTRVRSWMGRASTSASTGLHPRCHEDTNTRPGPRRRPSWSMVWWFTHDHGSFSVHLGPGTLLFLGFIWSGLVWSGSVRHLPSFLLVPIFCRFPFICYLIHLKLSGGAHGDLKTLSSVFYLCLLFFGFLSCFGRRGGIYTTNPIIISITSHKYN